MASLSSAYDDDDPQAVRDKLHLAPLTDDEKQQPLARAMTPVAQELVRIHHRFALLEHRAGWLLALAVAQLLALGALLLRTR
jgi:hypothetical protein